MQTTDWSHGVDIEVRGDDVVSHTGSVITRMLADATGLTGALSEALARPDVVHDRGRVLGDLAVAIADGATSMSDLAVLGDQPRVFGPVASTSTLWRTLNEIDTAALHRVTAARNQVRTRVWELIAARHGAIPPVRTAYGDLNGVIAIRIDATLVNSYSEKDCAAGNFKGGFGFHPLTAWCDNTGEALAIIPRVGNAGSNTATDHVSIIDAAIGAIPAAHRHNLLITIDGAGSSHAVLNHLEVLNARAGSTVDYSVGFDLDVRVRTALALLPETTWAPALDAHGAARDDADIAELTGLLRESYPGDQLGTWPAGMRIIIRREPIEEGRQLSLFEQTNGYRYQPFATNTAGGQPQRLEARHRVHARVEGFIRRAKATGLARWPSANFAMNTAWVTAVQLACDLLCWTRLLLLDGSLAVAEPHTLRYRLLHTGARIIKRARKTILRIPETWPWANELAAAFRRVLATP
jgi:Transposase DDE domain group 1